MSASKHVYGCLDGKVEGKRCKTMDGMKDAIQAWLEVPWAILKRLKNLTSWAWIRECVSSLPPLSAVLRLVCGGHAIGLGVRRSPQGKVMSPDCASGTKWFASVFRNRVARNSMYNLLGFSVPTLLMLVVTPILVRYMGTENYGLWTIAVSILGLMGAFEMGLGTAMAKFIAESTSRDDGVGLSATATAGFGIYLAMGTLLTGPLYALSSHVARLFSGSAIPLDRIEAVTRLVSLGLAPLLLNSGALAVPKGLQRFRIPTAVMIGQRALVLMAAVVVVLLGGSVEDVVLATVLLTWVIALGSMVVAFRMLRALGVRVVFSRKYTQKMLSFAAFAGVSDIGGRIFSSMDRVAVGAVLGIESVAYYAIAIGVANRLLSLSRVLTGALMPAASSWYATGDVKQLWNYMQRSTLAVTLMNAGLSGCLLLVSGPFMRLWMGSAFTEHALTPLRILVIVYALISINAPAYHIANGIGVPWVCALGALTGGALTIGLILVLSPSFGLVGAAWGNAGYWLTLIIVFYVVIRLRALEVRPLSGVGQHE